MRKYENPALVGENRCKQRAYYIPCATIEEAGFPENDEPMGNEFDHDESLDEFGALNQIPRKIYIDIS